MTPLLFGLSFGGGDGHSVLCPYKAMQDGKENERLHGRSEKMKRDFSSQKQLSTQA
jgi:hypothetical protein